MSTPTKPDNEAGMIFVKWLLAHLVHWAILYGAFVAGIDGAMYVLKFWVWVLVPLSLVSLSNMVVSERAKKAPQPVRRTLNTLQGWVTLGLLVWFGHLASATAWGFVMMIFAVHYEFVRKVRKTTEASAA